MMELFILSRRAIVVILCMVSIVCCVSTRFRLPRMSSSCFTISPFEAPQSTSLLILFCENIRCNLTSLERFLDDNADLLSSFYTSNNLTLSILNPSIRPFLAKQLLLPSPDPILPVASASVHPLLLRLHSIEHSHLQACEPSE